MGIGSNLKQILTEKKMTIKQLADESGIPINTLYSITKRDSENVNSSILTAITKTLDIPLFALMVDNKRIDNELEFIEVLENLGYSIQSNQKVIEWDTNPDGSKYPCTFDTSPDAPCCTIIKDEIFTDFTNEQYQELIQKTKESIEGMILLQHQKNKKST